MTIQGKTIIKYGVIFALIFFINKYYFHYTDKYYRCDISIRPSIFEWNTKNVKDSLRALKFGYSEGYSKICENIDKIVSAPSCGGWQGGCHYGKSGEIYLSTSHKEFIGWTAAVIVHETCHDIQTKEGRPMEEPECYSAHHDALRALVEVEK
ncbi:MAG: hypothetical protein A3G52_01705 [Candidatus Taylorbacteria bacterium RIFCSPLOWO2_12_FULL_43_20]|uniref:WLM domain-containing protein n=1 Tax=Candidatus Taylorbacteria bacterium RIFCSPLOWO2_12_FULL_43_20 TaxID=1802332 RepID=A0A1G2P345_9BACT|nr:MAG: hypothetical protein A3B98_00190 [Candidatus Taylorbacteria bacterium RIFCSPHIGHO2_02_FULL_43_55]OHA29919.1 MAG: hypothetical protein A3E92_03820 [Candidatus Taylorbacteria bacterium RIFCSPHIGHO2_12_FULL_42_34]OHA30552.1 MAG: hypothetical protein A3B09_01445 [Candidatus Taylorbacteria bacterium RIFCSPLOWO2_01_FULL_43_83]OHA38383.1 MAG: hypothetical protein A3H58_04245 [Candidatus Taylorbacteria bacterium RIFCSPLOWO2_02_FULL_43_22b]OHA41991.1 MAG: hypothetical protein A3G52_01705 [Candid